MKVADAHCDTLTKFYDTPFTTKNAMWNIKKFSRVKGILQYMAIYTPPECSGDSALRYAIKHIGNFYNKLQPKINLLQYSSDFCSDKINAILALEGGAPIIDDINNLNIFYKLGVRAMTLTWNHRNFIGDGVYNNYGLTEFGKDVVKEMEKIGMIIDVSHLSDKGFDSLIACTKKPFAATHSNSRSVCSHKRNLTDEQIKEIIGRKGYIGINFYSKFISDNGENLVEKFLEHIEYMLNLGCEDVLGFGADFDGMDESPFNDATAYLTIYQLLKEKLLLSEELIEKIMYRNLLNYTLKMI